MRPLNHSAAYKCDQVSITENHHDPHDGQYVISFSLIIILKALQALFQLSDPLIKDWRIQFTTILFNLNLSKIKQ